jgi:thiamine pyrophosphate-dependent acetolactate synthase large subunit-like protein
MNASDVLVERLMEWGVDTIFGLPGDALEGCDTLFIVGSSFPYIEFLPEPGSVKCVQIELDPQRLSLRHPADVALVADARTCLRALIPMVTPHKKDLLEKAQKEKGAVAEAHGRTWNPRGHTDEAASRRIGVRQAHSSQRHCHFRLGHDYTAYKLNIKIL